MSVNLSELFPPSGGSSGGGGAGAGMVIQPTEPADPVTGLQWMDSTTGRIWIWDDDKWLEFPAGGGGDSYDDTEIRDDLATETQERIDGDAALQAQINGLSGGGGGGSSSGLWEHIDTVSGTGVSAIEIDIPSGFDVVRVTSLLRVVSGTNPSQLAAGALNMRVRNDGAWIDSNYSNAYRVVEDGYINTSAIGDSSKAYSDTRHKMLGGGTCWGPAMSTFEIYNYENPQSDRDAALIKHFHQFAKDSDQAPQYAVGTTAVRNNLVPGDLKIDGMRIYIPTALHQIRGTVVVEAMKVS